MTPLGAEVDPEVYWRNANVSRVGSKVIAFDTPSPEGDPEGASSTAIQSIALARGRSASEGRALAMKLEQVSANRGAQSSTMLRLDSWGRYRRGSIIGTAMMPA